MKEFCIYEAYAAFIRDELERLDRALNEAYAQSFAMMNVFECVENRLKHLRAHTRKEKFISEHLKLTDMWVPELGMSIDTGNKHLLAAIKKVTPQPVGLKRGLWRTLWYGKLY